MIDISNTIISSDSFNKWSIPGNLSNQNTTITVTDTCNLNTTWIFWFSYYMPIRKFGRPVKDRKRAYRTWEQGDQIWSIMRVVAFLRVDRNPDKKQMYWPPISTRPPVRKPVRSQIRLLDVESPQSHFHESPWWASYGDPSTCYLDAKTAESSQNLIRRITMFLSYCCLRMGSVSFV